MPKTRGVRPQSQPKQKPEVDNDALYVNDNNKSVVNLGQKAIPPGQVVALSAEELANPAVQRFIRQGVLRRVRRRQPILRLVGDRPRILVIVHTMFRGGAEVATLELHRALRAKGFEQMLVVMYAGDKDLHTMMREEARQIFDIYEEYNPHSDVERYATIKEVSSRFRPDIVLYSLLSHVPKSFEGLEGRPPVIQIMHSELSDTEAAYYSPCTDAVVTVSRAMVRTMGKKLNIPSDRMYPIWNGIDPARLRDGRSLRKELRIPRDAVVVGMVGNMNDLKRPLMGFQAFAAVSSKEHMVFAGNPDHLGPYVERVAAELNMSERVHILGMREDIGSVFATLDILLNCSTTEGLPMTIIEAMFCKLPVIATAVGGTPELVRHEDSGFLYHKNDHGGLTKHLRRLLGDKQLRASMGNSGYRRAYKDFDITVTLDSFMSLLNKFLLRSDDLECSIVMPVYNGQSSLSRALWSVRTQTMPRFELIVVNDGSTDMSTTILLEHGRADRRIKVLNQPHLGIVAALNMGIKAARTPIIVRMDADDEMLNNRLEIQLEYMAKHRDIQVCGGQIMSRDKDGNNLGYGHKLPLTHEEIIKTMAASNPMAHPTVAFYKSAWEKAGGYKGDGKAEDYGFWVDMAIAGCRFANMEEPLLIYTHTHDGDLEYAAWRDSSLEGIRSRFKQGMGAMSDGR